MVGSEAAIQHKVPLDHDERKERSDHAVVIEIGSTAIRCVINGMELELPPLRSIKSRFKLAPAMGDKEPLRSETRNQVFLVLNEIRRTLEQYNYAPEDIQVICTSAFRDEENLNEISVEGGKLLDEIKEKTGFNAEVIEGRQEALYAAYGVLQYFPNANGTVADLGGRSTELALIKDGEADEKLAVSLPFGHTIIQDMLDQAEKKLRKTKAKELENAANEIKSDSKREAALGRVEERANRYAKKQAIKNVRAYIDGHLDNLPKAFEKSDNWFPIGGSWRKIGRAFANAGKFEVKPDEAKCVTLTDKFAKSTNKLLKKSPEELRDLGIPDRKQETLPAAILIMQAITDKLGPKHTTISRAAIADGVLHETVTEREKRLSTDISPDSAPALKEVA